MANPNPMQLKATGQTCGQLSEGLTQCAHSIHLQRMVDSNLFKDVILVIAVFIIIMRGGGVQ